MRFASKGYRDLEVWQRSKVLAKQIYQCTACYPKEEKFGMVNQMRRSAVSIPANLAEGHARLSISEYWHFVSIASGSVAELETFILLSADLGYLNASDESDLLDQLDEIGKMLRGLAKYLARHRDAPHAKR